MHTSVVAAFVVAAQGFRVTRKVAAPTCGFTGDNKTALGRISNGWRADECEWKWHVGLTKGLGEEPFCGGMLIKENWVLTAAHCVDTDDFQVVAGQWRLTETSGNEHVRSVIQVEKHPSFNPKTFNNDFALVKLFSPFELNECVGTVCLPDADVPVGTKCMATGWGITKKDGPTPDYLQEGEVEVMSNAECTESAYRSADITDAMLCAKGKRWLWQDVNARPGDDGGPLVCESNGIWTAHGVTSWGTGFTEESSPSVWSRVFYVSSWIEFIMTRTTTTTTTTPEGAPPSDAICPTFAANRTPNSQGDCKCSGGKYIFCSNDYGMSWNCPTAGSYDKRRYFKWDCDGCRCLYR